MKHQHTYDAQGKQTCCSEEEKIYTEAGAEEILKPEKALRKSFNATPADDSHAGHDHGKRQ